MLRHLGVEHDFDALLFQDASERFGYLVVRTGENLRKHLDDQHLGAHARVDGRELETDHATADNEQIFRNAFDLHRVVGVDDAVAVARPCFNVDGCRSGGDYDVLGGVGR